MKKKIIITAFVLVLVAGIGYLLHSIDLMDLIKKMHGG